MRELSLKENTNYPDMPSFWVAFIILSAYAFIPQYFMPTHFLLFQPMFFCSELHELLNT
jgi:hypothetical protein